MIVVDASLIVDLLLDASAAAPLGRRIATFSEVHAPELLDLEIAQVLRRHVGGGALSPERAELALDSFLRLRIVRHPHRPLLGRIWALRHRLTAYDAAYVALAELLPARLVTRDRKLADLPGVHASIEIW